MPQSRSGAISRPEVIAFDCYRTLLANDPADWESMFGEITSTQRLSIAPSELWTSWKRYEVRFRAERLAPALDGRLPPFRSYRQAWTECFVSAFSELGVKADPDAAAARCIAHMAGRPALPATPAVLAALAGRCRLAVLSNADDAFLLPAISRLGVRFEAVVSSEAAGTYKPAPSVFAALTRRLGLAPRDIWFVGDHLNEDVRGSQAAGMTAIWVNPPAGGAYYAGQVGVDQRDRPTPDAEVADLGGLLPLFDRVARTARR
jgi:2-haloalkanoic acid dehalogenase type II